MVLVEDVAAVMALRKQEQRRSYLAYRFSETTTPVNGVNTALLAMIDQSINLVSASNITIAALTVVILHFCCCCCWMFTCCYQNCTSIAAHRATSRTSVSVCKEDLLVMLRSEWRKVARDGATAVALRIFFARVLVQFLQNTVLQRGSFAAKSNSWRIAPLFGGKHLVLRNPTSTLWGTHLGPATCWKNVGRVIPTKLGAKHFARLPACTRSRGSGFARIILNPASTWAGPGPESARACK